MKIDLCQYNHDYSICVNDFRLPFQSHGHSNSHDEGNPEPLYAKVNKGNRRQQEDHALRGSNLVLDSSGAAGADSWV